MVARVAVGARDDVDDWRVVGALDTDREGLSICGVGLTLLVISCQRVNQLKNFALCKEIEGLCTCVELIGNRAADWRICRHVAGDWCHQACACEPVSYRSCSRITWCTACITNCWTGYRHLHVVGQIDVNNINAEVHNRADVVLNQIAIVRAGQRDDRLIIRACQHNIVGLGDRSIGVVIVHCHGEGVGNNLTFCQCFDRSRVWCVLVGTRSSVHSQRAVAASLCGHIVGSVCGTVVVHSATLNTEEEIFDIHVCCGQRAGKACRWAVLKDRATDSRRQHWIVIRTRDVHGDSCVGEVAVVVGHTNSDRVCNCLAIIQRFNCSVVVVVLIRAVVHVNKERAPSRRDGLYVGRERVAEVKEGVIRRTWCCTWPWLSRWCAADDAVGNCRTIIVGAVHDATQRCGWERIGRVGCQRLIARQTIFGNAQSNRRNGWRDRVDHHQLVAVKRIHVLEQDLDVETVQKTIVVHVDPKLAHAREVGWVKVLLKHEVRDAILAGDRDCALCIRESVGIAGKVETGACVRRAQTDVVRNAEVHRGVGQVHRLEDQRGFDGDIVAFGGVEVSDHITCQRIGVRNCDITELVSTVATCQLVLTCATGDSVIACAAVNSVVAVASVDVVVACAAVNNIRACARVGDVIATTQQNSVCTAV